MRGMVIGTLLPGGIAERLLLKRGTERGRKGVRDWGKGVAWSSKLNCLEVLFNE